MKITKKSLILLTAIPLLASCGLPKWDSISYKRQLNTSEKNALIAKAVAASVGKMSKYVYSYKEATSNDLREITTSSKQTTEYFKKGENSWNSETERTEKTESKTESRKTKIKQRVALFDEKENKFAIDYFEDLQNTYTYAEYVQENAEQNSGVEEVSALYAFVHLYNTNCYENKKGEYYFVRSSETETVVGQQYEGSTAKDVRTRNRSKTVVSLNKDLTFKSMTVFTTTETNKDPATNEIGKKMKVTYSRQELHEYSYKDKKDAPSDFEEVRKNAKNGYCLDEFTDPKLVVKAFDKDGTLVSSVPVAFGDAKRLSFSKYHFAFTTELDEIGGSYTFAFTGSVVSNAKATPIDVDKTVKVDTLNAGNSGLKISKDAVKMGEAEEVYASIEMDVETTSKGVTISNVVLNAFAHYE